MALPRPLSAKYQEDFAYPTVKNRLPVILTKVVDTVYRMRPQVLEELGEPGVEDLKAIVGELSCLKNGLQTNKALKQMTAGLPDQELWNEYLEKDSVVVEGGKPCWFKSTWLYTECYFYRWIKEAIEKSSLLKTIDPFSPQKQSALTNSMDHVISLAAYLNTALNSIDKCDNEQLYKYFDVLFHICLWGNKCDLSISSGSENYQKTDPMEQLSGLKDLILVDDSKKLWDYLIACKNVGNRRLDIVLDNAGFELYTDLVLAEFLLSAGLADSVHLHGKMMPWFVSDVTWQDFDWTLKQLTEVSDENVKSFGLKWLQRLEDKSWVYRDNTFWTLPHDFAASKSVAPDVYTDLSRAKLVLFKGDLNYRKLTGDLKWEMTTSFEEALRGFHPAPLCALRTLKCDLCVGLQEGVQAKLEAGSSNWMLDGTYAVVQFSKTKTA